MSRYNGATREVPKALYRLMETDTLVLVKGVKNGHYDVASFPIPGLRINRDLIPRLVPLSEPEIKKTLKDSEAIIWLANQTRGRPDLGAVVGASLNYRTSMLEETAIETTEVTRTT